MICKQPNHHKAIVTAVAFSFLAVLALASGCSQADMKEPLIYKGPLRIGENVELYYTEDNRVKLKMVAALVYEFENGDREFPKGLYLEFYDDGSALAMTKEEADKRYAWGPLFKFVEEL